MANGKLRVTLTVSPDRKRELLELLQQHPGLYSELEIRDPAAPPYPNLSLFICYRRDDSGDICGRIYDRLAAAFGERSVFWDVRTMPDAQDFRDVLRREIAACDLLLVVMGKSWDSKRRLASLNDAASEDYVRLEIETALQHGVSIIPVWVQGRSRMPGKKTLPDSIRDLVYLTARQVRPDPDFHTDMDDLIRRIKAVLELDAPPV